MANIMNNDLGGGAGGGSAWTYTQTPNGIVRIKKPAVTGITPAGNPNVNTSVVPGSSNTGGSGGVGGGGYGVNALMAPTSSDYISALEAARAQAIAQANAAVDEQTRAAENKYKNQLKDLKRDYQDLRNQSSVNEFKARNKQREMLANQGRLDSGAGRMEYTTLTNNFANNQNKINLQEQSEKRAINDAIAELYAQAASLKAQNNMSTLSNFGTALMYGLQNGGMGGYSYNPSTSDYYNAAQAAANTGLGVTPAVGDGQFANPTTAALAQAYENQTTPKQSWWDMIQQSILKSANPFGLR